MRIPIGGKNVEPAIIVVVQQSDASPNRVYVVIQGGIWRNQIELAGSINWDSGVGSATMDGRRCKLWKPAGGQRFAECSRSMTV